MIINTGAILCGVIHLHSKLWDDSEPADSEGYCFVYINSLHMLKSKLRLNFKGLCNTEILFKVMEVRYCIAMEKEFYGVFWLGFVRGLLIANAVSVVPG